MKIKRAVFTLFLILLHINFTPNATRADGSGYQLDISTQEATSNFNDTASENNLDLEEIKQYIKSIKERREPIPWEALVALLLGLLGIFKIQDWIDRNFLRKPKWRIELRLQSPDSHKIALTNQATGQAVCDTYYFRLRVTNDGNYQMEDIEVLVDELHEKQRNGTYKKVVSFLPLNLVWAHNHQVTMPKIQPKLFKHCDFGHIVETQYINLTLFGLSTTNNVALLLDTSTQPNTGSHIIFPGKYKIKLIFAANNLHPVVVWFKLEFKDVWDANEQRMLSNNVVIKKLEEYKL